MLKSLAPSDLGAVIVSIVAMVIFFGALVIVYVTGNTTQMGIMVGSAVTMAGTVVNFWVGSSSGSQKKDATIAAQAGVPPVTPVVVAPVVQQAPPTAHLVTPTAVVPGATP